MHTKVFHVCKLALLGIILSLLWGDAVAVDNGNMQRINQIKVAFILNIARFTSWPPETFKKTSSPYTLCFYRRNVFDKETETIRSNRISGRYLQVDIIDSLEESDNCTILFIPSMEISHFEAEVPDEFQRPLLTITDLTTGDVVTGISRRGVMVTMVRKEARIGLEVDLQQVRNARLQISSQLLKLAHIVREGGE